MNDEPRAVVREIGGEIVLDDPQALEVIRAIDKHNCENTLEINADRVAHFKVRMKDRQLDASEYVIVVLNVDDPHGGPLADILMPGFDWQEIRDQGEIPFARGMVDRSWVEEALDKFDEEAAKKLHDMTEVAVVVVDHGVAEIFPA